jgi:hypothetical protein
VGVEIGHQGLIDGPDLSFQVFEDALVRHVTNFSN